MHAWHLQSGPEPELAWSKDPRRAVHLIDPTIAELEEAVAASTEYVLQARVAGIWNGGGIHFFYSGHGAPGTGAWVLRDGQLAGSELVEMVGSRSRADDEPRGIGLVLDSCFGGAFMAHVLASSWRPSWNVVPRDMWVASLHNELAWELPHLGHGALTYSLLARRSYFDEKELAQAVAQREDALVRSVLFKHVPNPVTYLTDGDQHSIDLLSGHFMRVLGAGVVELYDAGDTLVAEQVMDALERAVHAPSWEDVRFP
jgi:hypothetical protein